MARKVWLTGLGLVVVGVLLVVLLGRPPLTPRLTPLDELTFVLLGLVPVLGLVCATVGSVMLGLAAAARIADRPLPSAYPASLLVAGLGAVALAEVVRAVTGVLVDPGLPVAVLVALSHVGGVLQMIGAAMVAVWLTGRLSDPGSARPAQPLARSASW